MDFSNVSGRTVECSWTSLTLVAGLWSVHGLL